MKEILSIGFWRVLLSSIVNPLTIVMALMITAYLGLFAGNSTSLFYIILVIGLRFFIQITILRLSFFIFKIIRKDITIQRFLLSFTKAHRVFFIFIGVSLAFLFMGNMQGWDADGLGFAIIGILFLSIVAFPISLFDFFRSKVPRELGIEAYGVPSDLRDYGDWRRKGYRR